jgi:dolichyl-diphosphooligosaccharide---protein glycosyltransferase
VISHPISGVFGLLQIVSFAYLVRSHVSSKQFQALLFVSVVVIGLLGTFAIVGLTYKGYIAPWTGRFYSLWDTGYAKKYILFLMTQRSLLIMCGASRYIPIIASVSEHQPTAWPSFFMDLQFLIFLFPAGVVLCFRDLRDEHIFVIIYALVGTYFAGVMVRLMLTLTPCVCVSAAVALSSLLDIYIDPKEDDSIEDGGHDDGDTTVSPNESGSSSKKSKKAEKADSNRDPLDGVKSGLLTVFSVFDTSKPRRLHGLDNRIMVIGSSIFMLLMFVQHCTWVTSNAYSSPSVVLASRNPDGSQHIIDDFREAYYWLRQNTREDAVVMSWWDYGYQIAGMADRPTLVDNNTWNNSTSTIQHLFLGLTRFRI